MGGPQQLARLEARLKDGLKLVQVREPGLAERALFTGQVIALAHRHGAKVMVKEPFPGADGIHFTASQLMALKERPAGLVAASCHTRAELERAMHLGLDFAVLSWDDFAGIAGNSTIPVYAIGGLTRSDLEAAWAAGAHGVAMIRGAWV